MFTIFHLLPLVGALLGVKFGVGVGMMYFGRAGTLVGALVGLILGFAIGRLPWALTVWSTNRALAKKTVAQLREEIQTSLSINFILVELKRRGEDIQQYLPVILEMLADKESSRRGFGWAALTSAYPDLADKIRDYSAGDSVEECRRKTNRLRQRA